MKKIFLLTLFLLIAVLAVLYYNNRNKPASSTGEEQASPVVSAPKEQVIDLVIANKQLLSGSTFTIYQQ